MPTANEERELKLLVSPDFLVPPLTGVQGIAQIAEEAPLELSATYYDTAVMALMVRGITLRYRLGEPAGPIWTVKLPADSDPSLRNEIEFAGNHTQPPSEVQKLLFGLLSGESLAPVVQIRTKRRRWLLKDSEGVPLAELVDDRVSVLDGSLIKDAFREIEVEARGIEPRRLQRIAAVIEKAGGRPEQRSKASRALGFLQADHKNGANPQTVSPQDPVTEAVPPALQTAVRRLQMYDPHARLGTVEGVHRMRVAVRRLRSVLRTFEPLLDTSRVEPSIEGLRWLGRLLGGVRDADVLLALLEPDIGSAEAVLGQLRARREAAMLALLEGISTPRYLELLTGLEALVTDGDLVKPSSGTCDNTLPELVARDVRKLRKAARALEPGSSEESLHRVRILAKRARYAAEMAADYTGPKTSRAMKGLAANVETVQNVLGQHQDATMTRDALLELGQQEGVDGVTGIQIGRLAERADHRAGALREQFRKVWSRLEKKKSAWSRA